MNIQVFILFFEGYLFRINACLQTPKRKTTCPHTLLRRIFSPLPLSSFGSARIFLLPSLLRHPQKSFEFLKRLSGLGAWRPISTTAASNPNLARSLLFFCWESGISQRLSAAATKKEGRKGRISAIRPHTPSFLFKLEIRQKADLLRGK